MVMPDRKQLLDILHDNFWVTGSSRIDIHAQGLIIEGHVECRRTIMSQIPVPFLKVRGDFRITAKKLESLVNAPQEVSGDFDVKGNWLTTLKSGPKKVGGNYNCSFNRLTSFEGAPDHVPGYLESHENPLESLEGLPSGISYLLISNNVDRTLPLLRCLTVQGGVGVFKKLANFSYDSTLNMILNDPRWAHKGKSHILLLANELKRAGYEGNAVW
jgi:hypothetical protein